MARKAEYKVTWAQAFRDIILRAMDRGQMLPLLAFLGVLIILSKLSSADAKLVFDGLVQRLEDTYIIGWCLFVMSAIIWPIHSKWQRRVSAVEIERVSNERNKLQRQLAGKKNVKSSKR